MRWVLSLEGTEKDSRFPPKGEGELFKTIDDYVVSPLAAGNLSSEQE